MFRRQLACASLTRTGLSLAASAAACHPRAAAASRSAVAFVSAAPFPSLVPTATLLFQGRGYCTPSAAPSGSALDIAMKVNKLKRVHQTSRSKNERKQVELSAWRDLNCLSEGQIMEAEGKAVSLLLNSWAYFSKFWEKGKEGPFMAGEGGDAQKGDNEQVK